MPVSRLCPSRIPCHGSHGTVPNLFRTGNSFLLLQSPFSIMQCFRFFFESTLTTNTSTLVLWLKEQVWKHITCNLYQGADAIVTAPVLNTSLNNVIYNIIIDIYEQISSSIINYSSIIRYSSSKIF